MPPTTPTASEGTAAGGRFRASDAERMAVAEVLQDAVSRGLLTPTEGSERTADAFAAVYRDDLAPLTADLPPAETPGVSAGGGMPGRLWWLRARAAAAKLWITAAAVFGSWSPRRRLATVMVVGLLLTSVVLVLWSSGGGHDFHRGGARPRR